MRFSVLPTACLFLAAVVKAQEPYTAVAKDIKLLTSKANTLITSASEMTVVNVATTTGPKVLSGLSELASKLGSTLTEQTTESYTGKGATEIANAYKSHAQVMQQLLSVLVGKQGLLAYFFLSDPMSQVLRQLEAAEDTLGFRLVDSLQGSAKAEVESSLRSLQNTLDQAVSTYSQ